MKPQIVFALLFSSILAACGGGGGGGGTSSSSAVSSTVAVSSSSSLVSSSSSSVSSSSSSTQVISQPSSVSSSQASVASLSSLSSSSSSLSSASSSSSLLSSASSSAHSTCAAAAGDVFIDCVNPVWNTLSAFEATTTSYGEYTDSSKTHIVTWQVITSADASHNQVIDVQFKDDADYKGLFRTHAATNVDMSAYATGKIVFDVKLLDAGQSDNKLVVKIECGYPCESHEHVMPINHLDTWTTLEVPVADLIEDGLDLTKIDIGFQIYPEFGKQGNVHFQVDNVRWVKGGQAPATTGTICYRDTFTLSPRSFLVSVPGLTNTTQFNITPYGSFTPVAWDTIQDSWELGFGSYSTPEALNNCVHQGQGTISLQIYLAKSYVDDGNMLVTLHFIDKNFTTRSFLSKNVTTFTPDGWTTISFNLADLLTPLNPGDDIEFVSVSFYANLKPTSVNGEIRVDNLVIRH